MIKHYIFIASIVFSFAHSSFGQSSCSSENLISVWKGIGWVHGIQTNVDSLISLVTDSIKTTGISSNTIEFKSDSTYTHVFLGETTVKNKRYLLDTKTCDIFLGTKEKVIKKYKWDIIYLDSKYLIISTHDPKGEVTHIFKKE